MSFHFKNTKQPIWGKSFRKLVRQCVQKVITWLWWQKCGVMTCGDIHCFGTHFLHLPGTVLGCRGCGASWARWTDRWLCSCESQAGSGVGAEEHLGLEAGGRSESQGRSTNYLAQLSLFFISLFLTSIGGYTCAFEVCCQSFKNLTTQYRVGCYDNLYCETEVFWQPSDILQNCL